MQFADGAQQRSEGVNVPYLSCFFVNGFGGEVVEVGGADVVGGGKESARVAPKSAAAGEARWNRFLALLVEVLAEVAGRAHVPRHKVRAFLHGVVFPSGLTRIEVESEVLRAVGFGYPVP